MLFPRSALSLSLEFDIATLLRRLGFKPDDPRQGSFGPVELSQPKAHWSAHGVAMRRRSRYRSSGLVRTTARDARGDAPRVTRSRTLSASASSAEASLFAHSARFFNAEEVR